MTETQFPKYEIMLILRPDLGEEKTNSILEEVRDLISKADGKVVHEDIWGVRDLAYKIKKQSQGFYAVISFTADPAKVKTFEHHLNIHQEVIRYLVQKNPKNYEMVTLAKYEEIAKEEELKVQQEAKEKAEKAESSRPAPRRYEKPVKKEKPAEKEVKEEKTKAEKVEEKEEKVEKPKAKKQASNLEDVDAKLKSIIDDPDIKL
ncbi:MAG: 30S ribosomal protein S6 [Candidatus Gracilibacteria bacterium]|nr:30S ribosomal protein S6 [Candidatus Gracilibacteria bacterium]